MTADATALAESGPIAKDAIISDDGRYRYFLRRKWDPAVTSLGFVMLNPSTADAELDDPTIRRCMGFARANGFGGISVLNLFAFRATDPKQMLREIDPVGPSNDEILAELTPASCVVAWGANGTPERVKAVRKILADRALFCLGVTKDGHPKHPLYVPGAQALIKWPVTA